MNKNQTFVLLLYVQQIQTKAASVFEIMQASECSRQERMMLLDK